MALKTYNPTTPSQRNLVNIDRSSLYKGPPVKSLTEGQHSHGGRNNTGRITSRFRGGGHKQAYRKIDFRRTKLRCRRPSSVWNTTRTARRSSR
jgi:large subunit ribosomal protein L2